MDCFEQHTQSIQSQIFGYQTDAIFKTLAEELRSHLTKYVSYPDFRGKWTVTVYGWFGYTSMKMWMVHAAPVLSVSTDGGSCSVLGTG